MITAILFIAGLVLLIVGAESLIRGAVRLASAAGVSALVIGLTVVAFGTSAPELAVSVGAAVSDQADLAVGNVVGSNICNTLLILGLTATIAPLVVNRKLLTFDIWVMLAASVLTAALAWNQDLSRLEGLVLALGLLMYVVWCIESSRREQRQVQQEYEAEYGVKTPTTLPGVRANLAFVAAGLGMLVLGARWVVDGAVAVATALGISELVIGLTIVAVGTSLPEIATSVVAAAKAERDIAVGNVVGSNIFNLLGVLGTTAAVSPVGLHVSAAALRFDIPIMLGAALLCIPIFYSGQRVNRFEGALLLSGYIAYTGWLVFAATETA